MDEFTLKLSVPAEHMRNVFGEYDSFIKKIEKELSVTIVNRDEDIKIGRKCQPGSKCSGKSRDAFQTGQCHTGAKCQLYDRNEP